MIKEKLLLLKIISKFFVSKPQPIDYGGANQGRLLDLIKETASDGICFEVLKRDKFLSPWIRAQLEKGAAIVSAIDRILMEAFFQIKIIPIPKVLFKDSTYRFSESYVRGTRFGCDIDIYVDPKNINQFDDFLYKNGFYADGAEINLPAKTIDLAHEINKDVSKYLAFQQELLPVIEELKIVNYRHKTKLLLRKLSGLKALIEKNLAFLQSNLPHSTLLNNFLKDLEKESSDIEKWLELNARANKRGKLTMEAKKFKDELLRIGDEIKSLSHKEEGLVKNLALRSPAFGEKIKEVVSAYQKTRDEILIFSDFVRNDLNRFINRKARIFQSANTDEHLQYNFLNGAFIDVHYKLFPENLPFKVDVENLIIEGIDKNLYIVKNEDSIIIDADHFCFNLSKSTKPLRFHGFLKYLTDLLYKLKSGPFDWQRIVELAKKTNSSSQVYFYLKLGKHYLDAPVPEETLKALKGNGSRLQIYFLERIDGLKILFNEPTFFVKLYSKIYLERGSLKYLITIAHRLYNKVAK